MAQAGQGLGVELVGALFGHAQRRADLAIEERAMSLQAIARDDDVGQPRLQVVHHCQERVSNGFLFQDDGRIRQVEVLERGVIVIVSPIRLDGSPDMVFNTSPGVAGESEAPLWVEPQDRTPEANATGVQGIFKGQITQHLLAHDRLDKPVVARHQLVETLGTTSLRLDELSGFRVSTGATLFVIRDRHRAPPKV